MQSKTTTEEEHTWQIWPIHPVSLNYLQVSRKQLHNTSNFSHQTTHLHYHLLCCPLLCHCLLRCLLPHKQMPGMNFSVVREEASVQIISFSTIIIIMVMMKSKENELLLLCKQCCLQISHRIQSLVQMKKRESRETNETTILFLS